MRGPVGVAKEPTHRINASPQHRTPPNVVRTTPPAAHCPAVSDPRKKRADSKDNKSPEKHLSVGCRSRLAVGPIRVRRVLVEQPQLLFFAQRPLWGFAH